MIPRELKPIELGKSETLRSGTDGTIVVCGVALANALEAAEILQTEGLDVGVVNARFVKPIDNEMIRQTLSNSKFVITVEEANLMGGFGSAFLEAANDMGLNASNVRRIGIPDEFVEHQSRAEVLASLKLDTDGIAETCRAAAKNVQLKPHVAS